MSDELESFQERLEQYNANFERLDGLLGDKSLLESGARKTRQVEDTKAILADALPIGVETLVELAVRADSDSVRLRAAMFLINISLGKDPAIKAEDGVMELIERLTGNASDV